MSSDAPSNDIRKLVEYIVVKYNITSPVQIEYHPGSEAGDGYSSNNVAVVIKNKTTSIDLFIKYALNLQPTEKVSANTLEDNESYFYDVIYPAYKRFLMERKIVDGFNNVPKCYETSGKKIIALENLKKRNFVLFDKSILMSDEHLILVLKTYAKFHAISFSFKDQELEKYKEFTKNTPDLFYTNSKLFGFDKVLHSSMVEFLNNLDPVKDKHILNVLSDKLDLLVETAVNCDQTSNEYSILGQGDAWINNMMFLYEHNHKDIPKDVVLIDWQIVRSTSPVFDISYFFYTIAPKEALSKLATFLKVYHEELSKQMNQLGSDPDVLYPYSALEKEWKQYGKYGFAMAFMIMKAVLYTKEEAPTFDNADVNKLVDQPELMFPAAKNQHEYMYRMRNLSEHFIENGFL